MADNDDSSVTSKGSGSYVPEENYMYDADDDDDENYMSDDSSITSKSSGSDVPQDEAEDNDSSIKPECNDNNMPKVCINAKDYKYPALNTPLYLSVHSGDLQLVLSLIDEISPEERNQKRSLMHTAAVRGQSEILKVFLDHHFPVNDADDSGNTPLHLAILENHRNVFDLLITESSVNIDALNLKGETPLLMAMANNIDVAETLIRKDANVCIRDNDGTSALDLAARQNQMQIVELLIKKGAIITGKNGLDLNVLKLKMQPLNYAVRNRNSKMVQLLMMNEINAIDVEDYAGETPLSLAVNDNDFQMLKYLIQHGRTINPKIEINPHSATFQNLQSENLLKRSLCTGSLEIWKFLLQRSTQIDRIAYSTLHSAVREGNLQKVKELLKTKEDKNSINSRLAVYIAVESENEDVLKVLLEEGYSLDSCFNDKSPIHTAATFNHPQLVHLLLKFGANLNSTTIDKQTPLHFATAAGQSQVVEFLLNAGSDFKKYKNYNSPLTYAICRGHETETFWTLTPWLYRNILQITEMLLIAGRSHRTQDDFYDELFHSATKIRVNESKPEEQVENSKTIFNPVENENHKIGSEIFICLLNYLTNGEIKTLSESLTRTYDFNHYPLDFIHLILEYNEYDLKLSEIYLGNINQLENFLFLIGHIGRFQKYPKFRIEQILTNEFIMSKNYERRVKLLVARFILLTNDSYSESEKKFYKEYKLYDWCRECERCLILMEKSEIVNDCSVTFNDILTHSVDRVALYIRNEHLLRILESTYMHFPPYADFLKLSVEKGKRRRDLIDECINCMFNLIKRNYNIQFTTVDIVKIFNYLSVVDLRRLLGAFS